MAFFTEKKTVSTDSSNFKTEGYTLTLNKDDKELRLQGVFINIDKTNNSLKNEGLVTESGELDVQTFFDFLTSGNVKVEVHKTNTAAKGPTGFFE